MSMKTDKITRCAIYVRISDDREGREVGVTNQINACEAEAAKRGWQVIGVPYKDNDRGASTRSRKQRPEYDAMLAAARAGDVDAILSYSTSRLTRRPKQLDDWLELAESGAIQAAFITGPAADWSSPQGRAVARTLAAWDAAEAEIIGDRVAFHRQNRAQRGEWYGSNVFGWDDKGKANQTEADAIRDACKRLLNGEGLRSIMRDWNNAGLLTRRGNQWQQVTFRQVLTRYANARQVVYRGEVVPDVTGQWDEILTPDTLALVRSLLADPARRLSPGNTVTYLCGGLAECSRCHARMRSASAGKTGKRSFQYRCSTDGCGNSITMQYLDQKVRAAVLDHYMTAPTGINPVDDQSTTLAALYGKLDDVSAARADITALIKARALTAAQAAPDLLGLNADEDAIRAQIAEAQASSVHDQLMTEARHKLYAGGKVSIADAVKVKLEIGERFDAMPVHQRRLIARAVLPPIVVHPGQRGGHQHTARQRGLDRIVIGELQP